MLAMNDQNSTVEHQIRPESLMEELGIKKDSYYNYLKHLKIKGEKDLEGKVYLTEGQANLMRQLRFHVVNGGKIEEFSINKSESAGLVRSESGEVDAADQVPETSANSEQGLDLDVLMEEAAELAGHRMTVAEQLVLQLASQMTYEDLPDKVRSKVDSVREATRPKFQPEVMASQLLNKWRQRRTEAAV